MIRPIRLPLAQVGQDSTRTPANPNQPSQPSQAERLNSTPPDVGSDGVNRAKANGAPSRLSGQEKEMIGSNFPSSERMSLRLYGPSRPVSLTPGGIGSRIDLTG